MQQPDILGSTGSPPTLIAPRVKARPSSGRRKQTPLSTDTLGQIGEPRPSSDQIGITVESPPSVAPFPEDGQRGADRQMMIVDSLMRVRVISGLNSRGLVWTISIISRILASVARSALRDSWRLSQSSGLPHHSWYGSRRVEQPSRSNGLRLHHLQSGRNPVDGSAFRGGAVASRMRVRRPRRFGDWSVVSECLHSEGGARNRTTSMGAFPPSQCNRCIQGRIHRRGKNQFTLGDPLPF